jgi:nucleotide-binding universal stress UspA family protein
VLAYDGSPGARRLVAEAATLLGGVPALVACVWWRLHTGALAAGGRVPGTLPPPQALRDEHDEAAERAARRRAADGAALAAEAGLDARPLTVAAEPRASLAEALAAVAGELDASVLVVAERSRAWPGRLLRRSPARELVDALPCPVLVVPVAPRRGERGRTGGAGRGRRAPAT